MAVIVVVLVGVPVIDGNRLKALQVHDAENPTALRRKHDGDPHGCSG
jgi:hypothetical protein